MTISSARILTRRRLSVVLADSEPVVRMGLRALFASMNLITVLAEAGTGPDVVRDVLRHRPDVLVMDLRMTGLDGTSVIREVVRSVPGAAVLVYTTADDDESVLMAMRAGARGYLLKGADESEIMRAIHGVADGGAFFGKGIASRLVTLMSGSVDLMPFPTLTSREREVLDLMASGMSNAMVARRLFLAPKTIRNYISAILTKLAVANRAEAVVRARQSGLGTSAPSVAG